LCSSGIPPLYHFLAVILITAQFAGRG